MTEDTTAAPAAENDESVEPTDQQVEPTDADGLVKALRAEREGRKQERKRATKAEAERDGLATKLTNAESKIAGFAETEAKAVRIAACADAGLDPALASRLQGETPEELVADAKTIAKAAHGGADFDGGARKTAPKKGTPEEEHSRFIRDIFAGGDETGDALWEGE